MLPVEASLTYGGSIMRPASASFAVARTDFNLPTYRYLMSVGAMVTIERDDSVLPFVGFVTEYEAARGDPEVRFLAQDHAWLLSLAVTQLAGSYVGSADGLIRNVIAEMSGRGEPPLPFNLDGVISAPPKPHTHQLQNGLDFLNSVASFTGYEWGWAYEITPGDVVVSLVFRERLGVDRRQETILTENDQLEDVRYKQRAIAFSAAAIAVGGSGDLSTRTAAKVSTASISAGGVATMQAARRAPATVAPVSMPVPSPALQGTQLIFDRTAPADTPTLLTAAARLMDTPRNVGEQLSSSIVESEIDMSTIGLGNYHRVRLTDTDLAVAREFDVRMIGIKLNPLIGKHDLELQVYPEGTL